MRPRFRRPRRCLGEVSPGPRALRDPAYAPRRRRRRARLAPRAPPRWPPPIARRSRAGAAGARCSGTSRRRRPASSRAVSSDPTRGPQGAERHLGEVALRRPPQGVQAAAFDARPRAARADSGRDSGALRERLVFGAAVPSLVDPGQEPFVERSLSTRRARRAYRGEPPPDRDGQGVSTVPPPMVDPERRRTTKRSPGSWRPARRVRARRARSRPAQWDRRGRGPSRVSVAKR